MKKSAKAKLPKPIKSRNPIMILKAVIRVIKAEPKRYDQSELITHIGDGTCNESEFPICGTIGCVAGWTNILTGARGRQQLSLERAGRLLHLTPGERFELFTGAPPLVRRRGLVSPRQHAADGVKHIKRFVLKKWGKKI